VLAPKASPKKTTPEPQPGWAGVSGIDDEVGRRAKAGAWRLAGAALGSGLLV
jgi:hypothetical protein